jgi:steroid delta-isomerase-like uncharacterized protein
MSTQENKALIARLYEEVFMKWNMAFVDEVFAQEYIDHSVPPGTPRGPEGVRQFYGTLRTAFPDLQYTVEDLIAEGNKVVVRWRWNATHRGEFLRIPATGKEAPMTGIAIYRITGGRIVERWVEVGLLDLAQRLGATLIAGKK